MLRRPKRFKETQMSRELCPKCRRPFIVVGTRSDGEFRTQYYGCRACNTRSSQPEVTRLHESSSTKPRDTSGRFVIER